MSRTAAAPAKPAFEERPKILLVDDKQENLVAIEAVVDGLGQEVFKARSGTEALRACLEHDFAAILLDVKMPDMDGFETAALIRDRERSSDVPIIFLTALKSEEHLFRGYYMGAVDYLYKPIVPEVLRSKVQVFVELSRKNTLLRKRTEQLEQLNSELEQRVEDRTRQLQDRNERLGQFTHAASHDLREPLRTIGSYARLLSRNHQESLDAAGVDQLRFIEKGVERMQALLDDLLTYSQNGEASTAAAISVSGSSALDGAISNLRTAIEESGAQIHRQELPDLRCGETQLIQVFQNLLGNAIKYRSGIPSIEIWAERCNDDWILSVRDNGIGIEQRFHDQIFGVFRRLHDQSLPGTGMGLAICKQIVERQGGRIWVESAPGKGSTFRFTLPESVR